MRGQKRCGAKGEWGHEGSQTCGGKAVVAKQLSGAEAVFNYD